MAISQQVKLEGMKNLMELFAASSRTIGGEKSSKILLKAATLVKNRARQLAPQGPTGNLKRGIVAKRFKSERPGHPAAFIATDYRIAPHAHLIEFGTVKMPARPFLRPALDGAHGEVMSIIAKGLKDEMKLLWR